MDKRIGRDKKIKEGFIGQRMIVLPLNIKKNIAGNSFINRFYLTATGYYPHAVNHDRERKQGCDEYILLYCTSGMGMVLSGNETVTLSPNSFYILPKNVPHHYRSSGNRPWSIFWVHFTGEHADHIFSRYKEASLFSIPYDEDRIEAFEVIFGMLEQNFEARALELAQIKLLELVSSFIYQKEMNPLLREEDVVSESIAFMKANLSRRLTVREIARHQQLSLTHYSRLFRARTGNSPNQYLNQLKIQKSCQYLFFSDKSIKEICLEFGFDDPYYFSRLFKKLMGISPQNYRHEYRIS